MEYGNRICAFLLAKSGVVEGRTHFSCLRIATLVKVVLHKSNLCYYPFTIIREKCAVFFVTDSKFLKQKNLLENNKKSRPPEANGYWGSGNSRSLVGLGHALAPR